MSTRTKILLSVVSVAIVNALAILALTASNTTSIAVAAAAASALCVMAAVVGVCVADNISKPLNSIVGVIREMSGGRLGTRLNLNRGDEIGVIAKTLGAFANNLRISVIGALNNIALGDLNTKIVLRDGEDEINAALKLATDSLRKLIVDDGGTVLAAAADGDLSRRLTGVYSGELAIMKDKINAVMQDFDDTLRRAAETAVSRQADANFLEEASLSIKAMSAMTERNADNTKQAKLLADEECAAVSEGSAAVKRVAEAVNQIKAASDNTAKIIKAFDDISIEANLLAINVDIEAAHAGEPYSGIALVAVEARDLAARCAETAKSAAAIFEESVKNADGGVKITADAAKTLGRIADRAGKVDGLIAEIAEASSKQARDIKQVSATVSQMNQAARRNITGGCAGSAAGRRKQRGRPATQKPFSAKRTYKTAALGLTAQARTAGAKEAIAIEDCELWR